MLICWYVTTMSTSKFIFLLICWYANCSYANMLICHHNFHLPDHIAHMHTSYLSLFLHNHNLRPENFTLTVPPSPGQLPERQSLFNLLNWATRMRTCRLKQWGFFSHQTWFSTISDPGVARGFCSPPLHPHLSACSLPPCFPHCGPTHCYVGSHSEIW